MKKSFIFISLAFVTTLTQSVFSDTNLPQLKLGAWEVSTEMPQLKTPMKMTHCITPETQEKFIKMADQAQGSCEKAVITKSGNSWTSSTNCNYQGTTAKVTATFTMEDENHYTSIVKTESPQYAQTMNGKGVYLGDCKSNNAQELQLGNGMKMDPKQLEAIAKAMGHSGH